MADELIDVDKEGDLLGSDVVAVDSKETVEGVAEDKTVDETVEDSSDASKDGAVEDSSGKDEEDLLDDLPELSAADESETTPDSPSLGKDTTSADNVDAQMTMKTTMKTTMQLIKSQLARPSALN